MKIITKIVFQITDEGLEELERVGHDIEGVVALCCGATDGQQNMADQQSAFSKQLVTQATSIFGSSSTVFNDLLKTFAPTVADGPNQRGFSAAESANLKAGAIDATGRAYKNAKAAVGNAQAAQGGGNTGLVSGAAVGTDLGLAEGAANQTAGELGQINAADYETGRQNYNNAVSGLTKATSVFDPAIGAANAATSSQEGAANTENQIAQENNSWVQSVTGALGGIAGAAMTGGMSNLSKGLSFLGKAPIPSGGVGTGYAPYGPNSD